MIRNLGQVAAIYIGSSAPRNTNLIWLDNTVVPFVFRAYDGSAWSEIATHKWVRAYVDGWLVTLPPRQLADDGDYMLINSNNVNYKITVKDFVKSAVGNPLDFKGVIRVSADFPNPSTLESGDMYVIITSPAGGTVTDPYSGKTFEDSEKIVWDEVTQSWESLGKIDITVDLTTSYSETEVTIHSSAGKETTIQGATDQLAGVMLPGQYSWLQALSNGSIVPGDPSPLTPLTPAHKHNYNDIINRLVSQQGTGESTIDPMSQKATTDALNLKFDKASVLQVSGAATDKVMSQKAVTDALKTLSDDFNNKLTNYLPLSGGTMTGSIIFPNRRGIIGRLVDGTGNIQIAVVNANNNIEIGDINIPLMLVSNSTDLTHYRDNNTYKIWDSYNLSKPTVYNGGAIGTPTTIYDRNLSVNGTGWTFLSATNAPTTSIFAPTTVGTKGYYLVSSGTGAPVWQQLEDLGDGKYLPLIGGTLTGQVTIQQNVDIKLRLQSTDTDNYCIIQAINAQASQLGVFGYAGDKWAIGHGGTYYEIWDKFNLSDPATLSGNNTFTGNNTFQAGKFNVGPFGVTSSGSLLSNISSPAGSAWSRSLIFRANNDIPSSLIFGGYNSVDNTNLGYAYIGIGGVNFSTAQYKFRPASLEVPIAWSLNDPNGNALVWSQSSTLAHLGRASGTTKIRSGAVDLIHTKETTDYKILDESNWESIIPNARWTYGFVGVNMNEALDLNTALIGPNNPKLVRNYATTTYWQNQPTGMEYGMVYQFWNSEQSETAPSLMAQLAFDVLHNVANGTGRMWFRTANNLGYGDSSNWKRVVTADENVVAFITANGYATVGRLDGSDIGWLRTPANGLLPTSPVSLNNGGNSSLGNSSWAFNSASIANVYANKISFGTNGAFIDNQSGDSSHIGIGFYTSQSAGCPVYVGSLCVSDGYANSAPNIPTNGIYSNGNIKSSGWLEFTNNEWTDTGWAYKEAQGSLKVLSVTNEAENKPTSYGSVLQFNSRYNHWCTQIWCDQTNVAGVIGKLRFRTTKNYVSTEWNPWTVIATEPYVSSNYLPLTGGILSGTLTINAVGSNPFVVNSNSTTGNETYMKVLRKGTDSAAIGFMDGLGAYIYNYNSSKYLFIDNNGDARVGTTNGSTKLALITDIPTTWDWSNITNKKIDGSDNTGPKDCNNSLTNGIYYYNQNGPTTSIGASTTDGALFHQKYSDSWIAQIAQDYRNGNLFVRGKNNGTWTAWKKVALTSDIPSISGYATQAWVNTQLGSYVAKSGSTMTGILAMNSRRLGVVIDVIGGAGDSWNAGCGALSVQVPNDSGQTPLLLARRSGATINTTTLSERLLDMALSDTGTIFKVGMSGVDALELKVTSFTNKVGIGKLFGKQIATTDQIPSIPSISISNSGSGNAVTAISASGHTLTVTKGATYLTSSSLDGYATQSWANGQFASLSLYNTTSSYTTIRTRGNEFCLGNTAATSASNQMFVNHRIPSGCTYAPASWVWRAGSSTSYADGYWGSLYMNEALVATQTWVNNKGYLTSHQTIYDLTFQAGTFSAKTFDPNGAAATVNIPTNTSHLTNDSGFITSSALNGYATQAWVNSQNFVKSTSTKKVTDIQPVDALPATQASGVLYLVFG